MNDVYVQLHEVRRWNYVSVAFAVVGAFLLAMAAFFAVMLFECLGSATNIVCQSSPTFFGLLAFTCVMLACGTASCIRGVTGVLGTSRAET